MICMGAGTNHWFHSDQVYRTFLALVMLCGCEGRNGGGWAHYVGQEKVRPLTGWQTVAFALDWVRPPRHQSGTPFFYLATDQWRYERIQPEHLASPLGRGLLDGRHIADVNALGARLGWLPSFPSFDRSTLELVDEAEREGIAPAEYVVRELREGRLRFACEDPDAPQNHPKVMTVWRANLLGSSGKGHEYFLKHLLGTTESAVRAEESPPELRPREVVWHDQAPEGKLDLMTTIDFRMTSNALFSDVVLPAATWYEKYDLSSTDLHPFVHAFNEAIAPPWEAKSDWEAFHRIAVEFSRLAERHLGTRKDLVAAPLLHDTPDEIAQPLGEVRDWKAGECEPVPGRTMPKLIVIERDYPHVAERWAALGPLLEKLGSQIKGAAWKPIEEIAELGAKKRRGPRRCRGRAAVAGARRAGVRGDPRAVGHDQRPAGSRGIPLDGSAHRRRAGRPRRAARRRSHHLRGRADAAAHGDHLARVVWDRGARPPLRAVHDQRRARKAVAHAVGPPALLPRSSVDARAG